MKNNKNLIQVAFTFFFAAGLALVSHAQQSKPNSVTVSSNKSETNLPLKDESGKVLKPQEAVALTRTGNYRMVRMADNSNKPYVLVKKETKPVPRPESAPVVVKPQ